MCLTFDVRDGPPAGRPLDGGARQRQAALSMIAHAYRKRTSGPRTPASTKMTKNVAAYQRANDCTAAGCLRPEKRFIESLPCSGWNQDAQQILAHRMTRSGTAKSMSVGSATRPGTTRRNTKAKIADITKSNPAIRARRNGWSRTLRFVKKFGIIGI